LRIWVNLLKQGKVVFTYHCQEALSKFFSEDYNGALKLFKTILRYDPTYESAQKYLKKTEARLKVLKKG